VSAEERAARLGVLLAVHQGAPILSNEDCGRAFSAGLGRSSHPDLDLIDSVEADDCHLAASCLQIEGDLQQRRWAALERLGQLMPGCDGLLLSVTDKPVTDAADPLAALTPDDARALLRALYELGWLTIERR
jgi:hypothetical protein